jgi:hypothetical protein
MGDGESNDEWSKGRSSPYMHVTSPRGKFDPYLPALPAWIYAFKWTEYNVWSKIQTDRTYYSRSPHYKKIIKSNLQEQ